MVLIGWGRLPRGGFQKISKELDLAGAITCRAWPGVGVSMFFKAFSFAIKTSAGNVAYGSLFSRSLQSPQFGLACSITLGASNARDFVFLDPSGPLAILARKTYENKRSKYRYNKNNGEYFHGSVIHNDKMRLDMVQGGITGCRGNRKGKGRETADYTDGELVK